MVYGYSKIVRKLLVAGANRVVVNNKGQTALQIAKSNEFDKITRMLDDKYSLLDYLKFICNTKIKYEPRSRSYFQPFLYYSFAIIVSFLSFAIITIHNPIVFWVQLALYAFSVVLFTTLIIPPKAV